VVEGRSVSEPEEAESSSSQESATGLLGFFLEEVFFWFFGDKDSLLREDSNSGTLLVTFMKAKELGILTNLSVMSTSYCNCFADWYLPREQLLH